MLNNLLVEARNLNFDKLLVRVFVVYKNANTNQILLLRRKKDDHLPNQEELPGGKIEFSESLLAAAQRELQEETGLLIQDLNLFQFIHFFDFEIKQQQAREFLLKVPVKTKKITFDIKEHDAYRWIDIQRLPQANLHPKFLEIVLAQRLATVEFEPV